MPSGGTGVAAPLRGGRYRVAYGGIASPYTDGYSADPLYTTSIIQGMVDRRSPGRAVKIAAVYESPDHRFKGQASEAYYRYDDAVEQNRTFENDIDLQYFFNPHSAGSSYHGLSFRERYAHLVKPTTAFDEKSIRTQLEYSF